MSIGFQEKVFAHIFVMLFSQTGNISVPIYRKTEGHEMHCMSVEMIFLTISKKRSGCDIFDIGHTQFTHGLLLLCEQDCVCTSYKVVFVT
jgi:hypothetical protein